MRKLLLTAAMIGFVTPALAQDAKVVTPTMLTWKDNPGIPKGGQIAILVGDPTKTGDTVVQRVSVSRQLRSSSPYPPVL